MQRMTFAACLMGKGFKALLIELIELIEWCFFHAWQGAAVSCYSQVRSVRGEGKGVSVRADARQVSSRLVLCCIGLSDSIVILRA